MLDSILLNTSRRFSQLAPYLLKAVVVDNFADTLTFERNCSDAKQIPQFTTDGGLENVLDLMLSVEGNGTLTMPTHQNMAFPGVVVSPGQRIVVMLLDVFNITRTGINLHHTRPVAPDEGGPPDLTFVAVVEFHTKGGIAMLGRKLVTPDRVSTVESDVELAAVVCSARANTVSVFVVVHGFVEPFVDVIIHLFLHVLIIVFGNSFIVCFLFKIQFAL